MCQVYVVLLKKFIICITELQMIWISGTENGWSLPRSKLWPTTYVIWSALGCAIFTSLFTMLIWCNTQETKTSLKIYSILQQLHCHWSSPRSALSMACIICMYITMLPKPLTVTKGSTNFLTLQKELLSEDQKCLDTSDITEIQQWMPFIADHE